MANESSSLVIFWFRRDLRIADNAGFAAATATSPRVVPVFVFDTNILGDIEDHSDRRVTFIHDSVKELRLKLRAHGSDLVILHGDPLRKIPELAERLDAAAVFTNRDYEPYATTRDDAVARALAAQGRTLESFKDQVVFDGPGCRKKRTAPPTASSLPSKRHGFGASTRRIAARCKPRAAAGKRI
jgi:deoxyribodipyrimidine photo-lyase